MKFSSLVYKSQKHAASSGVKAFLKGRTHLPDNACVEKRNPVRVFLPLRQVYVKNVTMEMQNCSRGFGLIFGRLRCFMQNQKDGPGNVACA